MSNDANLVRAEIISLRRQVRALAVLLACTLLLSGATLWHVRRAVPTAPPAPPEQPAVLVGRSLYLGEDPDRPYVRLKDLGHGAGLILADAEGRGRAQLVASPTGGRLALGSGPPAVVLDSDPNQPAVALCDDAGRQRITLSGGAKPRIVLLDEHRQVRLELSAGPGGSTLSLAGPDGRVGAVLNEREGSGRLRLLDAQGKVLFEAPQGGRP